MFRNYWNSLSLIAHDVGLLFRHFIHWNLSKLSILLSSVILSLVLSLPFIAIAWFTVSSAVGSLWASWVMELVSGDALSAESLGSLMGNTWALVGLAFCLISMIIITIVVFSYGYFLLLRVYKSYADGEPLGISKNFYWKRAYLQKFAGVFGWSTLYMMIPVVLGVLYFYLVISLRETGLLTPETNALHSMIFGALGVGGIIAIVASFTYLIVRTMMSNMLLLEWTPSAPPVTARSFVTDSFAITKGRILEIIRLLIPALFIIGVIGWLLEFAQNERNISVLISRANVVASQNPGTFVNDHEYVKTTLAPLSKIGEESYYNLLKISKNYTPSTATMSKDYLRAVYPFVLAGGSLNEPSDYVVTAASTILSFLCIEWVMLMVYFSIFHIVSATPGKAEKPSGLKSAPKKSSQKDGGTKSKPTPKSTTTDKVKAAPKSAPKKTPEKSPAKKPVVKKSVKTATSTKKSTKSPASKVAKK